MRHTITNRGTTIWTAMIRENMYKDLAHETLRFRSLLSLIITIHIVDPLYVMECLMYEVFVFCDHCNQYCESLVCNRVLKVFSLIIAFHIVDWRVS